VQNAGVSHTQANARTLFLVVGSLLDQFIDDVMGFVDVIKSAIPKTPNGGIIFFSGDVIVSLIQEFLRTTKAARGVHSRIDRRMIVQVLAGLRFTWQGHCSSGGSLLGRLDNH